MSGRREYNQDATFPRVNIIIFPVLRLLLDTAARGVMRGRGASSSKSLWLDCIDPFGCLESLLRSIVDFTVDSHPGSEKAMNKVHVRNSAM